ncbi:hypothetical protein H0G86_012902 [Trichoderma simmonsii]|uniref:Secreted protein n=1 Tax=Trichoderma simmonsii TaxID=1491479 RepID=A0A8G0PMG6_9HYPO|nr:hypothetical protein H0G86_012902 [Trichoderma simmonsii]
MYRLWVLSECCVCVLTCCLAWWPLIVEDYWHSAATCQLLFEESGRTKTLRAIANWLVNKIIPLPRGADSSHDVLARPPANQASDARLMASEPRSCFTLTRQTWGLKLSGAVP